MLHTARWKYRTQKGHQTSPSGHHRTICRGISSQLRHVSTMGKNLLGSNMSSRCPHNMVILGLLAAQIGLPVWGTPANFNGFRVLAALLHDSQVLSVSQTLRRWTEGATYVRQGDHHVGHWPTFQLCINYSVSDLHQIWRRYRGLRQIFSDRLKGVHFIRGQNLPFPISKPRRR